MRTRAAMALALAILMLSAAYTYASDQKPEIDVWRVLKGHRLSSVAWSPKGDYIAFVATPTSHSGEEEMRGPLRAGIWLLAAGEHGRTPKLRRLVGLTREQGIPVALFWLDENELGWAAAGSPPASPQQEPFFSFMKMGLQDRKQVPLVQTKLVRRQDRSARAAYAAPDDVYWDSSSRSLLFSGPSVGIMHLPDGKLDVIDIAEPTADIRAVTICGSLRNTQKLVFYIAGTIMTDMAGPTLWRSDSWSLRQTEIIARFPHGRIVFPRTSPSDDILAWLQLSESEETNEIVVRDLRAHTSRSVATFSLDWEGLEPALGCPYSWSPDGKQIAYSDGSRIKIVQVDAKPPRSTDSE